MKPATDIIEKAKAAIRDAFTGVTLGGGVGLNETQALDDYASNEVHAACRAADEENDWVAITLEALNNHSGSPSFFDVEGMRFHLPAYLIAYLDDDYKHEFAQHLLASPEKFRLLTPAQRNAVELYLRAVRETENMAAYRYDIERALQEWAGYRA
ncbi:hypothetical protein O8B93_25730 [Agrobacterium rhizogenes]|uniref:DUF6714 family protein n=1 Tax=Rhizobium rhizogenes TaxID=359 RepID=UPI0022B69506|nr:DUF6714 family protein [Rhizobium rhizogenes]MCZ7450978.1 hypothetical protein [Rhizobium rhizogenes]